MNRDNFTKRFLIVIGMISSGCSLFIRAADLPGLPATPNNAAQKVPDTIPTDDATASAAEPTTA